MLHALISRNLNKQSFPSSHPSATRRKEDSEKGNLKTVLEIGVKSPKRVKQTQGTSEKQIITNESTETNSIQNGYE